MPFSDRSLPLVGLQAYEAAAPHSPVLTAVSAAGPGWGGLLWRPVKHREWSADTREYSPATLARYQHSAGERRDIAGMWIFGFSQSTALRADAGSGFLMKLWQPGSIMITTLSPPPAQSRCARPLPLLCANTDRSPDGAVGASRTSGLKSEHDRGNRATKNNYKGHQCRAVEQ